jgi:molecular chaperone GrpE
MMEEQATEQSKDNNETMENETAKAAEDGATNIDFQLADLQNRLQQIEQESANYKDSYLRTAADLKNFKRRTEEERGNLIRNATAGLVIKLLPVLDDFDLAMHHVPEEVANTPWFEGMQGIQRKLQLILEGEGVKPIEALGQPFDPHFHDAVMHEDAGPDLAGKVTADLRRGYMLHDKVLRPSMVKVGSE